MHHGGRPIAVDVLGEATVGDLLAAYRAMSGYEGYCKLTFGGEPLEDANAVLADLEVGSEAVVEAVPHDVFVEHPSLEPLRNGRLSEADLTDLVKKLLTKYAVGLPVMVDVLPSVDGRYKSDHKIHMDWEGNKAIFRVVPRHSGGKSTNIEFGLMNAGGRVKIPDTDVSKSGLYDVFYYNPRD